MSGLIASLFCKIDSVPSNADEFLLKEVTKSWCDPTQMQIVREALFEWLDKTAQKSELAATARETSTHYVWPLHVNDRGYGIAINEFKTPEEMVAGYATSVHNHRYSFVSLVLSGGYRQVRSEVKFANFHQAVEICDRGEDYVREGDMVTLKHNEFHRLHMITNRTVTLLVKCPAAKKRSLSVDTSTHRVTWHLPVEARIRQLMNALVPNV